MSQADTFEANEENTSIGAPQLDGHPLSRTFAVPSLKLEGSVLVAHDGVLGDLAVSATMAGKPLSYPDQVIHGESDKEVQDHLSEESVYGLVNQLVALPEAQELR